MKLLADMGVSMATVRELRDDGHDVVHLRDERLERLPDEAILEKANSEGRVVLTFDLDFGDLLAAGVRQGPSVVLCRLVNETPTCVTPRVRQVLSECAREIGEGAIVVVEDARYRLRRLPITP